MFQIGDHVVLRRPRPMVADGFGAIGQVVGFDKNHRGDVTHLDIKWISSKRPTCRFGMYVDQFDPVGGGLMPEAHEYYAAITGDAP